MVWLINLNARQKSPAVESKRSRVKTAERQIKNAPASKRPKIKTRSRQVENARASNQKWARVKTADRQNAPASKRQEIKTPWRQVGRRGGDPGAPGPDQQRREGDRVADRQPPVRVGAIGVIEQLGADHEHRAADQQVGEPGHRGAIRAGARSGKKAWL